MKTIKFSGILIAVMLLSFRMMAQQTQQLVVPLSDPGKPFKIEVSLISGSIKVIGYAGKEVVIDAETDGSKGRKRKNDDDTDNDANTKGMHRISGSGMDITAREKNNSVNVSSGFFGRTLNLVIKVPQTLNSGFKLSTINNGTIEVSNINGDLELSNTNGLISATNISGSVVANTINGNIVVNFKNIDAKAAMAFSTLNGKIDVTFPANLRASVKLKSDRGSIYTDFDVATESKPKVEKNDGDGMYRVSVDATIYGKINGGGPEILMKNMNGSIYLRKAK